MRSRLFICGLLLLTVTAAAPAYADLRLAYVDVQRALNECDAGRRAKADMQSRLQVIEARLESQRNEVQSLKDELEKKGMLMNPDQRQNLQDQLDSKAKNLDREYKDSQDELQKRDTEATNKIVHDLAQVIRAIGERAGFTMVMEKGSILWGAPANDITDQVIRAYNGSHNKVGSLGDSGVVPAAEGAGGAGAPGDFGSSAAKHSSISK